MGESFCLVRSFSQPSQSPSFESNEGSPHRVLTESVSFGRFASESLQWEKWSAFTQNRYLEEIERFTKPGSVAQKKAFFEAHFRNRAAGKTLNTKKIEEVSVKTSDESLCQDTNQLVDSVVPLISVMDESTDVRDSEDVDLDVENLNLNPMTVPEDKEALDKDDSATLSKERRSSSSRSSKLEPMFAVGLDMSLEKTRKEPPSSRKRSTSVSKHQNKSPLVPFPLSISCAPSDKTDKKIVTIPQNRSRSTDSGPSSVHMPFDFAYSAHQTTKAIPKRAARNSTTEETASSSARNSVFLNENEPTGTSKGRKRPLPQKAKQGSKAAKSSASVYPPKSPKLSPPSNRLPVIKRKHIEKKPNNERRGPSVGSEDLSTHCRGRAKSFTVSSPFNFKSDERAEKRKEFFKKLEERNKKEDTVKAQLSCGVKANQNSRLAASQEHKKKPKVGGFQVPLTSPRFRGNQTPRKVSSVKTSNTSNESMEKHKRCKIHPSQTKKKTQENLSPNIVRYI